MSDSPLIRHLGRAPYEPTWRARQEFTDERQDAARDEIWFVEHPPVFTLGLNASREHLLAPGDIPGVQIDRGGQVTYHGPGQMVVYPLIDLRRHPLGARGGYVDGAKLASVGLRIRRRASYHGLALNVSLDLEPFERINVCGHRGLAVTRLADPVAGLACRGGA